MRELMEVRIKGEIILTLYCALKLKDFWPCLKETCFIHLPGDYQ